MKRLLIFLGDAFVNGLLFLLLGLIYINALNPDCFACQAAYMVKGVAPVLGLMIVFALAVGLYIFSTVIGLLMDLLLFKEEEGKAISWCINRILLILGYALIPFSVYNGGIFLIVLLS